MEINWFDIEQWEDEEKVFYEAELWGGGDCDSRYFTTLSEARACLRKAKPNEFNCVKKHNGYNASII